MELRDGNKREYTAEELAVLGGVIDYADRMLYEDKHLNVLGGMADSYWSKNKGRSMEGALEHFTRYGAIVFMVITLILNVLLEHMG